jgi:hypothetical protein
MNYWPIIIISAIIWAIIWGIATNKVIQNKGYEENWFLWGFLFSFIAFIVACTKPSKTIDYMSEADRVDLIKKYKDLMDSGAISEEDYLEKKEEIIHGDKQNNNLEKSNRLLRQTIFEIIKSGKDGVFEHKIYTDVPKQYNYEEIEIELENMIENREIDYVDGRFVINPNIK